MINLRYHIVSIVAVFLALGIGVALGSSFVDGFVVDTLRRNVDSLESDRDSLRDQVGLLQDELDTTRSAHESELETLLPLATTDRLADRPVMIIATQGADSDAWELVRDSLLQSSATYEGTLWLSDRLDLSEAGNRTAIADALGLVTDNESVVRPALLLRFARALFPDDVDGSANLGIDNITDTETLSDTLVSLRDAALISFDNDQARTGALADVPAFGTVYIILGDEDVALAADQMVVPLLAEALDENLDPFAVVVQPKPADSETPRDSYVTAIRSDDSLNGSFATVDSVDTFDGILSMILLAERRETGHLGVAPSAAARLPDP
ncbi:MAG: copper transporter [Actinomycetia bacterium]|nr:copper transporter [Actinomycetes bacterium]MCP4962963.1 copper transporter [Actinomycetes bacterium]